MSNYINEAFKALEGLNEDTFSTDSDSLKALDTFLKDNSVEPDEITVYDMEAEVPEDIEGSYEGKVILDCNVCHSKLYKDKADIKIDEETNLANIEMECPYCYSHEGFKIIGEVAPFAECLDSDKSVDESLKEAVDLSKKENTIAGVLSKHMDELSKYTDANSMRDAIIDIIDKSDIADKPAVAKLKRDLFSKKSTAALLSTIGTYMTGTKVIKSKRKVKEDLGSDIDEYQKWVDYDMKRYGRVSGKTNRLIKKAGLQLVKDKYGDYEVIAGKYDESLKEDWRDGKFTEDDFSTYVAKMKSEAYRLSNSIQYMIDKHPEYAELFDNLVSEIVDIFSRSYLNESLEGEDGWSEDITEITEPFFVEVENAAYELRNTVRGASGFGKTVEDLAELFRGFSNMADDIAERLDDEEETLTESVDMDSSDQELLVKDYLITMINGEWKTIQDYNQLLNLIKDTKYADMESVISDINSEENMHVGQLQECLKVISPDTLDIAKGEDEANKQLNEEAEGASLDESLKEDLDTDSSIISDIVDNYKAITGYDIIDIFEKNSDEPVFNQEIVDKTIDKIKEYVLNRYNIDITKDPDILYELDDKLLDIKSKLINESVKDVTITTDDSKTTMTSEDDGKVTVTTEPAECSTSDKAEVIKPVKETTKLEIESNDEDVDIEEFDEESFDDIEESFLKEHYSNVKSYATSKVTFNKDSILVEGVITFDNNIKKKTSMKLVSESRDKNKKYKMICENLNTKQSFNLIGDVKGNKFITQSLKTR